jgi:hypothetical protein
VGVIFMRFHLILALSCCLLGNTSNVLADPPTAGAAATGGSCSIQMPARVHREMVDALGAVRQRTDMAWLQALPSDLPDLGGVPESGPMAGDAALALYGPGQRFSYNHLRQMQRQLEAASRTASAARRRTVTDQTERARIRAGQSGLDLINRARSAVNAALAVMELEHSPRGFMDRSRALPNHRACRLQDPPLPPQEGRPSGLLARPDMDPLTAPQVEAPAEGSAADVGPPPPRTQPWAFVTPELESRTCSRVVKGPLRAPMQTLLNRYAPISEEFERRVEQQGARPNEEQLARANLLREIVIAYRDTIFPRMEGWSLPPTLTQIRNLSEEAEYFRSYLAGIASNSASDEWTVTVANDVMASLPDRQALLTAAEACAQGPDSSQPTLTAEDRALEREDLSSLRCQAFQFNSRQLQTALRALQREARQSHNQITRSARRARASASTEPPADAEYVEQIHNFAQNNWAQIVQAMARSGAPKVQSLRTLRDSLARNHQRINDLSPGVSERAELAEALRNFQALLPTADAVQSHIRSCAGSIGEAAPETGGGSAGEAR